MKNPRIIRHYEWRASRSRNTPPSGNRRNNFDKYVNTACAHFVALARCHCRRRKRARFSEGHACNALEVSRLSLMSGRFVVRLTQHPARPWSVTSKRAARQEGETANEILHVLKGQTRPPLFLPAMLRNNYGRLDLAAIVVNSRDR